MNIKKRLISCILILVLLVSILPVSASAKKDLTKVLAETKQGVVQIYARDVYGRKAVYGTGFGVGDAGKDTRVFVTNWHVVTASGVFDASEMEVWILRENCTFDIYGYPDSTRSIKCEVLKTTSGYPDYAIIRATTDVTGYNALPLMSSKKVEDGTAVYALGYPAEVTLINSHNFGIDDITSTNGMISQHMQVNLVGDTWNLMHTAQISSGNSGGPLINSDGAVIGVNTYVASIESDRYMSIYIDYVMDGLKDLGIEYDTYGSFALDDTVLIIGGAVLLVAIIVAIVLLMLKKQKEEQERQAAEQRRMLEEQRRREEMRRKEEQRRRQEEEKRRQQEINERAHLRCWDGHVAAVGGGATIGRDSKCTIALPDNSPGVSRTHCRVEMQGGQLVVIDLGSSYGTLIHGKKIPPHTPVALKQGSTFYLGSDKYRFTVC